MFSWSYSYSCYKNSILKLISKFLLFYFVSISYNRNKSNFNVFRYFWSGVEPSNMTCYSLLNLLLVFFGEKLSSCKNILVYFIAIKQNNTSPTVQHGADSVFEVYLVILYFQYSGKMFNKNITYSRIIDAFVDNKFT